LLTCAVYVLHNFRALPSVCTPSRNPQLYVSPSFKGIAPRPPLPRTTLRVTSQTLPPGKDWGEQSPACPKLHLCRSTPPDLSLFSARPNQHLTKASNPLEDVPHIAKSGAFDAASTGLQLREPRGFLNRNRCHHRTQGPASGLSRRYSCRSPSPPSNPPTSHQARCCCSHPSRARFCCSHPPRARSCCSHPPRARSCYSHPPPSDSATQLAQTMLDS
jgi:hypothetical protein